MGRCLGKAALKAVREPHLSCIRDTLSFIGRAVGPVHLLLFFRVPSGPLRIWMLPLVGGGGVPGRGREQTSSAHRASTPGFCSELAQPMTLAPASVQLGMVRTLASALGSATNVPDHRGQAPSPSWSSVSSSFKLRVGQIKDYKLGALYNSLGYTVFEKTAAFKKKKTTGFLASLENHKGPSLPGQHPHRACCVACSWASPSFHGAALEPAAWASPGSS